MALSKKYKRKDIIDDDKEGRLLSSLIELVFEPNHKGWTVNRKDSSIQTKPHPTTKRPIYRAMAENKSTTTFDEMYSYHKAGYPQILSYILYHIDDDHDICYDNTTSFGPWQARDRQFMRIRFKICNHKLLNGNQYNIIGLISYNIPDTHILYKPPPKKVVRSTREAEIDAYYQLVDAEDIDFKYVHIRFTTHHKGWVPNIAEDFAQDRGLKLEVPDFYKRCLDVIIYVFIHQFCKLLLIFMH